MSTEKIEEYPKGTLVIFHPKDPKDRMAGKEGKIHIVPLPSSITYCLELEDEKSATGKTVRWATPSEFKKKIK